MLTSKMKREWRGELSWSFRGKCYSVAEEALCWTKW